MIIFMSHKNLQLIKLINNIMQITERLKPHAVTEKKNQSDLRLQFVATCDYNL